MRSDLSSIFERAATNPELTITDLHAFLLQQAREVVIVVAS